MAQRLYQQFPKSLIKEVVSIYAKIPIGATGAVGTLSASANMGIKSVSRTSAGLYVITLGDSASSSTDLYNSLLSVQAMILFNGISAVRTINVKAEAVASAGTITIQCSGPTDASTTTPIATDPDNGSILYLEIKVKNSSVQ